MKKTMLKFKSEKLTKEDAVALMLLGGDCGQILDGVDLSDGINQNEVNIINGFFNGLEDGENGYIIGHADGTVEVNLGNLGDSQWGDARLGQGEWDQWKIDNGYQ